MFSIKASLILLVLAVLFVHSSQAQTNITIAEAEAADASAKQWLQRQNIIGRSGASACANDKCVEACDEGWEKLGDHCYHWVAEKMNWTNAETSCQEKGGHLVSVSSNETMGFVLLGAHSRGLKYIWLGGNDVKQEGVWKWTDCTPWELELWGTTGQPDNAGGEHCLTIWDHGTVWNDWTCSRETEFLCSRKICPTNSNSDHDEPTTATTPVTNNNNNDVSSEVPTTHVSKNDNNAGALLIGFISLSGVLLLLLILTVVCFVSKTRSRTNAAKTDINPVYGADNEADAAKENNRRVSNAVNYD